MTNSLVTLPDVLREFIDSTQWTFAKTMPEWPHEYIVRGRVDEDLFVQLVRHIRANGYEGKFYRKSITYYDDGGLVYWTMGAPLEETTIINRCRKENSYEYRLLKGTLPESKSIAAEQTGAGDASQRARPAPLDNKRLNVWKHAPYTIGGWEVGFPKRRSDSANGVRLQR